MNTLTTLLISTLVGGAILASGCSKDESKSDKTTEASQKSAKANKPKSKPDTAEIPKTTQAKADTSFAAGMMQSYETCRALLASDKAELADCAAGIVAASKTAHKDAPEAVHGHISTTVSAAEALAKIAPDDIEVVRLGFGEVSKAMVAMLTAAPEAAKSYHLFECPMAKGYKKWAQPGKELENPYMGTKMLSCGEEVHDHHLGMK
ncbi:MAG: DUF3347 domain-containing protein [Kofleriaceae bacterium]|nr:DUF3347 domain-containing protein [Kofleriaceae bacterium]